MLRMCDNLDKIEFSVIVAQCMGVEFLDCVSAPNQCSWVCASPEALRYVIAHACVEEHRRAPILI